MNGKRWRKAAVATALSLQLASPAGAFLLFGGEPASITPVIEYYNEELGEYFVTASYDEIVALDAGAAPAPPSRPALPGPRAAGRAGCS